MQTSEHLEEWFGLPVEEARLDTEFNCAGTIYRIGYSYDAGDENPLDVLKQLLEAPDVEKTAAIVIGQTDEGGGDRTMGEFIELLAANAAKLPNLRGLFLGDILQEENEISWIHQSDISPALTAFPGLEELIVRGQEGLKFSPCQHASLKKLIIETGGMPKEVLRGLAAASLPGLEHLELWLGTDEYGWDGSIEDIEPLVHPDQFPKLRHLALGNSDLQNEIAESLADAPILDRLEVLDLSLGVMTDEGAASLLASQRVRKLKKLNLHRNYLSSATAGQFALLGIEVDVSGQEAPDTWDGENHYYVAVGE